MKVFSLFSVFVLGFAFFLFSCSKEPKKGGSQPVVIEESLGMPMEVQQADSAINDTILPSEETGAAASTDPSVHTSYDGGYLDGEAMSEEDRLAGRPGMQVGMDDGDDDDDDYEDGFDDGYEE